MKKLLALLMAFVMLLSFAACGGNENLDTTQPAETTEAPKFDETVVTDGKTNKLTIRTPIGEFTFNESNTEGNFLAQTNIVKCGTLENAEVNIGVAFAVTHAAYDSVHDYVTKSFKNHTIFEEGKIGDYTTYIRQNGPSAMQIIVCLNNFEFAMLEFKLPAGAKRDDYAALREGELFNTVYDNLLIEAGAAEVEDTDTNENEAPANEPVTTDKGFVTVTPAGGFIYDEAQSDNQSLVFTNTSLGANAAVYVYDNQNMTYDVQKMQFATTYPDKEYTQVTIGANTFDAIESNTGVTYLVANTSTGNAMYVMVWSCSVADATPLIETIVIG